MKRKLLNLLLVILLLVAIPGTLVLASDISGALYKMSIVVSNNGTLANYVSTNSVISTPNLITGGFLNSSANNCAVLDKADNDVPFMPGYSTNPWAFWVETIGADSYLNYDLYTADTTGGDIVYFPGLTGMLVSDNSTIELGSDFEVNTVGWVDTTLSANASLVFKDDAFRTYISGTDEITSAITYGSQVFPTVDAVNGGNDLVNQLNHTVNLPAGIIVDDLLLIVFSSDGNEAIGWPGGWVELFEERQAACTLAVGYRIADGSEGATIVVTTGNNRMTSHTSYRISGYSGVPEAGASTNGNNVNPDPPNLAPSWGARNTLWFAVVGYDDGRWVINNYPANYTDGRLDRSNDVEGVGTGSARRELNIVAEDPGVYTLQVAGVWIANTIAIAPAELEVTAIGIESGEYTVETYGVDNEPDWATGDVLHFTGAADSNVNAGAINDNIPNLWVSLWFNLDSTFSAASATDQFIWGKFNGAADYVYAYLESDDGMLYFQFDDGVNPFTLTSTTVSWTGDAWYSIITSLSNTPAQRLLVDGVAEDTDVVVASNTPNGGDFCYGDFDDPGAGTGFIGEIQNVIVGTDDLTVAEEAALYAGTAPGDETNYWYIDEGTGLTTYDYGTGGNDGTIDNAPTWETSTFTTGSTGRLCDFYIEVDDGVTDPDRWGANLKGIGVIGNGNDWEFFLNDAMPYVYSDRITVGGVLHAWHEWEYDSTFHDRSYYGLSFDGNDYIDCGNFNPCGDGDKQLTVIVWAKGDTLGPYLFTRFDFGENRRAFYLGADPIPPNRGLNVLLTDDGSANYAAHGKWYIDTTDYTDDVWRQIAFTWNGNLADDSAANRRLKLFVDGVRCVDGDLTKTWDADITTIFDSGAQVLIGSRENNSVAQDFIGDGTLDEAWLFNRALSATEIEENYNSGAGRYTPYSSSGLKGEWHIEDGSGAVVTDTSGEGNDGTITGATWINGLVPRPAGSPGTNDATPTFRTASSDPDVVATAVSFQPIEEAKAPPWTLTEDTATWVTAANVVGNFTTTPTPTYPGASVIEDIATASGTPAQLPFVIIWGFVTLAISLSVSYVLRTHGSRSIMVKVIVIGILLWIGQALGIIDFWMLVFFLLMGFAVMAASKPGEVI